MQQHSNFPKFRQLATDQFEKGVDLDHIESNLSDAGASSKEIEIILQELKALHFIHRKKRGFKLVFAGSFFLVFGFLITLLLFHSGMSISYAMYGITTLGILLLLWGMVDVMGW